MSGSPSVCCSEEEHMCASIRCAANHRFADCEHNKRGKTDTGNPLELQGADETHVLSARSWTKLSFLQILWQINLILPPFTSTAPQIFPPFTSTNFHPHALPFHFRLTYFSPLISSLSSFRHKFPAALLLSSLPPHKSLAFLPDTLIYREAQKTSAKKKKSSCSTLNEETQ